MSRNDPADGVQSGPGGFTVYGQILVFPQRLLEELGTDCDWIPRRKKKNEKKQQQHKNTHTTTYK